jgi:hypothetical protein
MDLCGVGNWTMQDQNPIVSVGGVAYNRFNELHSIRVMN